MVAAIPQTFVIEDAPEIELRGGLFYVTDRNEGVVIVRVFRPHTFYKTFARYSEVARSQRLGEVIPFPDAAAKLGAS